MFAQTLAQLREASGLSQQEVADKLNIARATFSNLESGKRSPTLEQINAISVLFEISPAQLIGAETYQPEIDQLRLAHLQNLKHLEQVQQNLTQDGHHLTQTHTQSQTHAQPQAHAQPIKNTRKQSHPSKTQLQKEANEITPREIVTENPEKLREVLLYVLNKVGAKPNVGETVLYKLLYFIDFDYYEKTGKSITGLTYIRNHFGPTPAKTFTSVVKAMEKAGVLEVVETKYFNHTQKKYLPVITPRLDNISGDEVGHIDDVLARLSNKTANELTDYSHRDMPWLATKHGQKIDYQFAMYRTTETSVKEPEDEL